MTKQTLRSVETHDEDRSLLERLEYETIEVNDPHEPRPYVYQPFTNLEPESFEGLKESIRLRGMEDPIWVDERMAVIDGHQRLRAWQELEDEGVDIRPVFARQFKTSDVEDFWVTAVRRNTVRRQLTRTELDKIVDDHLKYLARYYEANKPSRGKPPYSDSTSRIAKFLGVGSPRVLRRRRALELSEEIPRAKTLVSASANGAMAIIDREKAQKAGERISLRNAVSERTQKALQIVAPDGELIVGKDAEELQEKLAHYLAEEDKRFDTAQESYRLSAQEEVERKEQEFWNGIREDVTQYLQDVAKPESVERLEDIPVKVWDEGVKNAIGRRQLRMEKAMIAAAQAHDALVGLDPDEISEAMLRASEDDRKRYLKYYEALGAWYAGVAGLVQQRLDNPIAGVANRKGK